MTRKFQPINRLTAKALRNRRFRSIAVFAVVGFLALILATKVPQTVRGQIPNLLEQNSTSSTLAPSPSVIRVGNLISAPVKLDGYLLFRIASTASTDTSGEQGNLPIETRVTLVENELKGVISNQLYGGGFNPGFDPKTLKVTVGTLNGATVILVADDKQLQQRQIVTVTSQDAQLYGLSVEAWAEALRSIIAQALLRAQQERSPGHLLRQSFISGSIILGTSLLTLVLRFLTKRAIAQWETLKESEPKPEPPPQEIPSTEGDPNATQEQSQLLAAKQQQMRWEQQRNANFFQRQLLQIGTIAIWATAMTMITGFFPWTRWLQSFLLKQPVTLLAIFMSTNLAIRLSDIAIDRFLNSLVETQSLRRAASARQTLRFSTFSVVLKGISTSILTTIGIIWALYRLTVPIGPVLTGAGILGFAISFAAQSLVKDIINGSLILLEDQYAVGDVIEIGGVVGFVEYMNLRITQIRSAGGRFVTIPNSSISIVHNLTKDWSRVDLTVAVAYDADVNLAIEEIERVAREMAGDPDWKEIILEPVVLLGVEKLDSNGVEIMIWIKTQRLQQWNVGREFRRRLKLAFDEKGIEIGVPQRTVSVRTFPELLLPKRFNLDKG